jgi:sulfofructose kinase
MKIKRLKSPSETFDLQFPTDMSFDVAGLGQNSVDYVCVVPQYPHFDSKMQILEHKILPGGQIATAIAFLAHAGLKTKYIGKIGSDEFGQLLLKSLNSETVDTSSVRIQQDAANQCAFIIIDKSSGERTILWQRDDKLNFSESELNKEDICNGKILHLDGTDPAASLRAATWAQEQNIPAVMDLDIVVPDSKAILEKVDFLITSSNFPPEFTGVSDPVGALLQLQHYCSGFVAMTLGSQGAMCVIGDECISFPALKVRVVDSTGAGDIFHGGFIYGLMQNWPLNKIMAFANAAAGLSCAYLGARSGIRPLSEIMQSMDYLIK